VYFDVFDDVYDVYDVFDVYFDVFDVTIPLDMLSLSSATTTDSKSLNFFSTSSVNPGVESRRNPPVERNVEGKRVSSQSNIISKHQTHQKNHPSKHEKRYI